MTVGGRTVLWAETAGHRCHQRRYSACSNLSSGWSGTAPAVATGLGWASIAPAVTVSRGTEVNAPAGVEGGLRVTGSSPPVPARAGNWPGDPQPPEVGEDGRAAPHDHRNPEGELAQAPGARYSPVRDSGPEL